MWLAGNLPQIFLSFYHRKGFSDHAISRLQSTSRSPCKLQEKKSTHDEEKKGSNSPISPHPAEQSNAYYYCTVLTVLS